MEKERTELTQERRTAGGVMEIAVKSGQGTVCEMRSRCAASGAGPGVVGEAIGAVVTEDDVI